MATDNPPHKRRKIDTAPPLHSLRSLQRDVSPPPYRGDSLTDPTTFDDDSDRLRDFFRPAKLSPAAPERQVIDLTTDDIGTKNINGPSFSHGVPATTTDNDRASWPSPFHLTTIRDLPASQNRDTVNIKDILGDVMLKEVWLFNYMHDIPWVMSQFDTDIRDHLQVYFVHGNWKQDDASRIRMEKEAKEFPNNVKLVAAYMPEAFGTHHSKVMVLLRRDDTAQIVVHTANMIPFDWTNMTQAAWISPLLPLATKDKSPAQEVGKQFKDDIISYFGFYGKGRCGPLVDELKKYSFSAVRAVFIGSVPGRHKASEPKYGWPKLHRVLSDITTAPADSVASKIFAQLSSIATLGVKDSWLTPVFFKALSASASKGGRKPEYGIIFPTAQEIRDSLNGYRSGSSIHYRTASAAQQKQLTYLRPFFHHWGSTSSTKHKAGRDLAAPHIKTYIRFSNPDDPEKTNIDWALVTSANLSTQAWGAGEKDGVVRVCSYEAGVLVHPGLWGEGVVMKPVFGRDKKDWGRDEGKVVSLRMPYGLSVGKYSKGDEVWTGGRKHELPDRHGVVWDVDGF